MEGKLEQTATPETGSIDGPEELREEIEVFESMAKWSEDALERGDYDSALGLASALFALNRGDERVPKFRAYEERARELGEAAWAKATDGKKCEIGEDNRLFSGMVQRSERRTGQPS